MKPCSMDGSAHSARATSCACAALVTVTWPGNTACSCGTLGSGSRTIRRLVTVDASRHSATCPLLGLGVEVGVGAAAAVGDDAPPGPGDAAPEPGAGTLPHAASSTDPSAIDNSATTAPGRARPPRAALRWPVTLR